MPTIIRHGAEGLFRAIMTIMRHWIGASNTNVHVIMFRVVVIVVTVVVV
jgi:hypothetical protein